MCNYFRTAQHPFFSSFMVWYISKEPTLCFNIWSNSARSFLGSAVMCVVLNISRSPKTATVVLQGTLLSRAKALPLPLPPLCHHRRYVLQSCEEPDHRTNPGWDLRLRLRPWSWNIKYIAIWTGCWKGEILHCFNLLPLAAPIGCWSGPATDQWWGTSWPKPLPWCLLFAMLLIPAWLVPWCEESLPCVSRFTSPAHTSMPHAWCATCTVLSGTV